MLGTKVLTGLVLVLVLLLSPPTACAEVKNLHRILSYLDEIFSDGKPFTVAINILAHKCTTFVKPGKNFLPEASRLKVKLDLQSPAGVYLGEKLIAAKPKPSNGGIYPPEYLLLVQPDSPRTSPSLLEKLLNKNKQGCVIIYTYNSPCVDTCSTPEGPYSLLPGLELLRNHTGPKAFAFRHIKKIDVGPQNDVEKPFARCYPMGGKGYGFGGAWENYGSQLRWEKNIREINARVPLYRCKEDECYNCIYGWETEGYCLFR